MKRRCVYLLTLFAWAVFLRRKIPSASEPKPARPISGSGDAVWGKRSWFAEALLPAF
jgi:hypothetical protein